jgi:hypothetical protein
MTDIIIPTKTIKSKYFCDHDFFSRDNEASFYWAGFLAADGCSHEIKNSNSKILSLQLSDKDINHVLKFKKDICFNGKITKSINKLSKNNSDWSDSSRSRIVIFSNKIFDDLNRFNIVPRKTKIYKFPDFIKNHNLANHFMRGYVDGDGNFFLDKSRNRVCFELRGTFDFLSEYQKILELNLKNKSDSKVTTPDSTSKIKYSGKRYMPEIVDFLYKDATIYLERKYDIAKQSYELIKNLKRNRRNKQQIMDDKLTCI